MHHTNSNTISIFGIIHSIGETFSTFARIHREVNEMKCMECGADPAMYVGVKGYVACSDCRAWVDTPKLKVMEMLHPNMPEFSQSMFHQLELMVAAESARRKLYALQPDVKQPTMTMWGDLGSITFIHPDHLLFTFLASMNPEKNARIFKFEPREFLKVADEIYGLASDQESHLYKLCPELALWQTKCHWVQFLAGTDRLATVKCSDFWEFVTNLRAHPS